MAKKKATPAEKSETPPEVEGAKETPPETPSEETTSDSAEVTADVPEFGEEQAAEFLTDDEDDDDTGEIKEEVEKKVEEKVETPPEEKGKEVKPEVKEVPPEKKEIPPAAEKPEGEKPAEEAPPTPTAPIPPTAEPPAPEQAPPVTPTEVAPVVAEPALTPEEQTKAYEDWREEIETSLSEGRYAISEEEVSEMDISPEAAKAHSKGMSRVYMDAITGAIGHIASAMPQLLEAALIAREETTAAESEFYEAWPQLNNVEHKQVVSRLGKAHRQLYPTVSKEDFIRDVGAQAMIALRLAVEEVAATPSDETPPASSVAFKPAGSTPPGGGPVTQANVFTKLAEDFDKEEEELDIE